MGSCQIHAPGAVTIYHHLMKITFLFVTFGKYLQFLRSLAVPCTYSHLLALVYFPINFSMFHVHISQGAKAIHDDHCFASKIMNMQLMTSQNASVL